MPDIECNPYAPFLIESTRAIGYSVESAIADIIDNSIAADSKNVSIYFGTVAPYIAIVDDGCGMTSDQLTEAMRYGSSDPSQNRDEKDLGRYGLGMKTASLSQCRRLTVISKQADTVNGRQWDIDHIEKTKKWSLIDLSRDEIENIPAFEYLQTEENGTLVVWQNLDKLQVNGLTTEKAIETKIDDVRVHLSLVFHRYLSGEGGNRLVIKINNVLLKPFDPFFSGKSMTVMAEEKIEISGRKGKVIVTPYTLPHPSKMTKDELEKYGGKDGLRSLQGFYIYRNRRLLTWGTWFGLRKKDEFTKLARVKVDIPNSLDDLWTLDIKKSTAYPPEVVKIRLRQLMDKMMTPSVRTYTFRKKKEVNKDMVTVWDKTETRNGVKYEINKDHPVYQMICSKIDDEAVDLLREYIETIENNLPFNNIYIDMSSDTKIVDEEKKEAKERAKTMALIMLRSAQAQGNIDEVYANMKNADVFKDHISLIDELYSEVINNAG